ncbi:Calx-beta domain-containing protein [Vibrio spartinae]|nr:Calx-beta domain-containing protein [Vibrio spartinae]
MKFRLNLVACLAWGCLIAVGYWVFSNVIFKPDIEGVRFSKTVTKVKEEDAIAEVVLLLEHPATQAIDVKYETRDRTAQSGVDYTNTKGTVHFSTGDTQRSLFVSIQPDRNISEPNETFDIILTNVRYQPKHTIVILEQGVNKDLLAKSELVIASLSVLAADIANDIATIKIIEGVSAPSKELASRYEMVKSNLSSERERYLLLFKDALALDPEVIKLSIKKRLTALEKKGYKHQLIATTLMEKQLINYMNDQIPMLDLWISELGELVTVEQVPQETDENETRLSA